MARELPHSTEAEQAILGAMLVYPSVVNIAVDQDLQAEEFYLDVHRRIFGCMMDLRESGQNIDVATLITRLNDTEQLALAGGADYVIKLSDSAVSSANGIYYINIIKERYHRPSRSRKKALIPAVRWMMCSIRRSGRSWK